jgi:RNA-directed DNA polymerase
MLSNIFLHHVLDKWFEDMVRPRMRGKATLVRFADDFVMTFETYHDAKRVMEVLGKRLDRFGLLSQACDKRPNQKHRVMRRKRPVHPFCSGNGPLDLRII